MYKYKEAQVWYYYIAMHRIVKSFLFFVCEMLVYNYSNIIEEIDLA